MTSIRVLLVDDQSLFRSGLRKLLGGQGDIEVVGEAATGEEGLHAAAALMPDVILMDVRMPVLDGVAATRRLHQMHPTMRVILLTTFDDDTYVFEGLRAGAVGYLLKDADLTELTTAIRAAAQGGSVLHPNIAAKVVAEFARMAERMLPCPDPNPDPLSLREYEVVQLVARHYTNREIADRLGITEVTVKRHMSNILDKLDVTNRMQVAERARDLGLV